MANFIHYIWHGDIFWIFIVAGFEHEHEHELGDYGTRKLNEKKYKCSGHKT